MMDAIKLVTPNEDDARLVSERMHSYPDDITTANATSLATRATSPARCSFSKLSPRCWNSRRRISDPSVRASCTRVQPRIPSCKLVPDSSLYNP